jgi:hypothetical protein
VADKPNEQGVALARFVAVPAVINSNLFANHPRLCPQGLSLASPGSLSLRRFLAKGKDGLAVI